MNNGIVSINSLASYQTDFMSNYTPATLLRYSQLDASTPLRLLGNSSPIPSVYGLPINTNSTLDIENNLIYIVDTSVDPTVQTAASASQYSIRSTLVQVPTTQANTRFIIDWGDGSIETYYNNQQQIASHTYNYHGIYYIQISFPTILSTNDYYAPPNYPFLNGRDGKIIGILSFGNKITRYTLQFFTNCFLVPKKLSTTINALSLGCGGVLGSNLSQWNIANLTSIPLFNYGTLWNEDVSAWKFNPAITSLANMFLGSASFNNGDAYTRSSSSIVPVPAFEAGDRLNNWDVSNITNMSTLFYGCSYFNQNLTNWNVSKVTNFTSMFGSSHNTFNSFDGDLTGWQLASSGVDCTSMFAIDISGTNRGRLFTGKGVDGWNTSGVINMRNMFGGNPLFNKNLSSWVTNNVTDMSYMFSACSSFVGSGLSGWNTSNVTSMSNMFIGAASFNQPLNNWNVRKVTNFANMFQGASSFNSSLSGWEPGADTTGTSCSAMFQNCSNFTGVGLETWDTSKITNMSYMFYGTLFNKPISSWNISSLTNTSYMFAYSPFNQNINNWDMSKVGSIEAMFFGNNIFSQDISNWDIRRVSIFGNFVSGNTWGTDNYSKALIAWANLPDDPLFTINLTNFASDASYGSAYTRITSANHGLNVGMKFIISNSVNYNGEYRVVQVWSTSTFAIQKTFSGNDTGTGTAYRCRNASGSFSSNKYSSEAAAARNILVNTYGWTITDGGQA